MLDIHSHILPNVDDGSSSLETSIKMLQEEVRNGVTDVILTPHYFFKKYTCEVLKLEATYNEIVDIVKKENIPLNLYLGQEIYFTNRVNLVEKLNKGEILTLNGTKHILLEFNLGKEPEDIQEAIYNFTRCGYKVIVAHVERYSWITKDKVNQMINEGALIQVNAESLMGRNGLKIKFFTKSIVKKGLVNFIASDIHSFKKNELAKANKKYGKYIKEIKLF